MNYSDVRDRLWKVAVDAHRRGPGYSQQSVVLLQVARELGVYGGGDPLPAEQFILTCWNDFFATGELSWGYNLDNPDPPFFHIPRADKERQKVLTSARKPIRSV